VGGSGRSRSRTLGGVQRSGNPGPPAKASSVATCKQFIAMHRAFCGLALKTASIAGVGTARAGPNENSLVASRRDFTGGRLRTQEFSEANELTSDEPAIVVDAEGWTWIRQAQGMLWNDCANRALYADQDGSIWVGTSRGLSHFMPASRHSAKVPPPVLLTSIQFGGGPLAMGHCDPGASSRPVVPGRFCRTHIFKRSGCAVSLSHHRPGRRLDPDCGARRPISGSTAR